ncbi:MAG: putative membrane protein [Candidatus Methanomarinus sp.]|nr:MAG: putative membrane protein [ANME-2 cluster archaeon]KAF5424668.1 putative membrane protein [ANME-2 cluster archaeon]
MGISEALQDFIYTYYINPIKYDLGYNPVNTITWAIILGFVIFVIFKILNKLEIRADWEFTKAILPYIVVGSTLRVMEDAELFKPPLTYVFTTPPIYVLMFIVTILLLIISIRLHKSGYIENWKRSFAIAGIVWSLINLGVLLLSGSLVNPGILIIVFLLGTGITLIFYFVFKKIGYTLFNNQVNITILWAHLLDASSTFIGVDFMDYHEKHVVPTLLIDLAGTASIMIPLKIIIFIPVIYILDTQFEKDDESEKLKDLVKLVIIILGLAPATRNTLSMVFGV